MPSTKQILCFLAGNQVGGPSLIRVRQVEPPVCKSSPFCSGLFSGRPLPSLNWTLSRIAFRVSFVVWLVVNASTAVLRPASVVIDELHGRDGLSATSRLKFVSPLTLLQVTAKAFPRHTRFWLKFAKTASGSGFPSMA